MENNTCLGLPIRETFSPEVIAACLKITNLALENKTLRLHVGLNCACGMFCVDVSDENHKSIKHWYITLQSWNTERDSQLAEIIAFIEANA
jgi:hypothetical protein